MQQTFLKVRVIRPIQLRENGPVHPVNDQITVEKRVAVLLADAGFVQMPTRDDGLIVGPNGTMLR